MDRYAAYPDTTSGYIVVDTIRDPIVALYPEHCRAEHAARRLNKRALIAPPRLCTPSTAPSCGGTRL